MVCFRIFKHTEQALSPCSTHLDPPRRHQLHHLPTASHAPMLEGLTLAASAMPPKLRLRPGLGPPCPLARLKRILPLAPPRQPLHIQGLLGCTSSRDVAEGASEGGVVKVNSDSPFIFNANEKRKAVKEKSKRGGNGKDRDAELVLQGEWVSWADWVQMRCYDGEWESYCIPRGAGGRTRSCCIARVSWDAAAGCK